MEIVETNNQENKIENTSKKRIPYIDIARGIAIILMVAGHVCRWDSITSKIIYSFHMPLFIIVSGMFFKEKEKQKELIIKIFKNLLLPYVITILFTSIISCVLYKSDLNILIMIKQILLAYSNYRTFWPDTPTAGVLWFIPFLAIIKIIFYVINKIFKNDISKGIISCLLAVVGVVLAKEHIYLPWSFDIALASIIFYYIGYILKKYDFIEKILQNKILLIILLNIWYIGLLYTNIELAVRKYSLMSYVIAISGAIIIFGVSKLIQKFLSGLSKILMWYGRNSIYILCFHYLEVTLFNNQYEIASVIGLFITKLIIITILTYIVTNISKCNIRKEKANEN